MQNYLYIRLSDSLEWALFDSSGQSLEGPTHSIDDKLLEHAKEAEVIVIVPGADVVLTSVQIPKMTHARLMQAIPNMLEENLAQSTDQLHFAIGKHEQDQPLSVAVVSKQKMQRWIRILNEKIPGIQDYITAFTPDTLCLPWAENQWAAMSDGDLMIVRTGRGSGYTVERSLFTLLTQRMIEQQGAPDAIHLYGAPEDQNLSQLGVSVNQHDAPDSALSSFAEQLRGEVDINLLQEEFERNHKYQVSIKLAKVAAVMVGVWVAMLTMIDVTKYVYLQRHVGSLKQEISVVYKEIFPKATSVVSPRRRVERLLKDNKSVGSSDFIKILARVAPVVQKGAGIKVSELDYDKSELEVKIEATDFDLLDKLVRDLKATGVKVEQRGASKTGGAIQSKVVIRL